MTDRTKGCRGRFLFVLFLSFLIASCAEKAPLKNESPAKSPASPDASADAALGTLPKQGQTEAGKQVEKLEAETTDEEALREIRRREREEEQRRLHESVTQDRIATGAR